MRFSLLLPLLLALPHLVFSQNTFKRLYGTSGNDEARYVEPLVDGTFLVAGLTTAGGLGGQDAMLAKFSSTGTVVWSKVYGGAGIDLFSLILPTSDGNFIALGETSSFGAGGADIYLVKVDPNGNVIWERTAGGSNQETSRGIAEVSDGYVITGGTQSTGAGFWDIYVEKIDFGGVSQWNKAWGGGGGDIAGDPLPAANNEIWITGFTFVNSGNHDPILFRLAANGTLLSASRYAIPVNNGLSSLDSGGAGLVSGGGTWVGNAHFPLLMSFNASGGVAWAKRYPVPGGNFSCLYAEPTPDGGVVFAANEIQNDTPDAIMVKTDNNGDVQWAKSHPFEGLGRLFQVRPAPDGGYVAVGYAFGVGRDWFLMKTNALGEVQLCCPEDLSITPITISPSLVSISPAEASGAVTAGSPGNDIALSLSSQDICNGPICCIPPVATIAPSLPITCNAPSITLNGTGSTTGPGITYQWTGPGIVSGGTTLQPVVNQGGTYTLVVTDNSTGCFTEATVIVVDQSQLPLAVATAGATVTCANPTVPISGTGSSVGPGITYQWTGPGIVSGGNALTPVVDQGGTYVLTVTNTATGCVNSVSVTVNQNTAPPMAEAGAGQQLDCDSPLVQLDGSASSSGAGIVYQWSGPGVAGGGNTSQPTVNQPGVYTLTVTNTVNGCASNDQVTVAADFSFPMIQISPAPEISCAQPQVMLDASGSSQGPGFSIQWTTQNGQILSGENSLSPVVGASGLYVLTILNNQNGCSAAEGVMVSGDPAAPEADAGPGGELTCAQTLLTLQGSASGNNLALLWTASPGAILSGAHTLNPVVGDAGSYILTLTDTLTGCVATDTVEVTQDGNLPELSLTVSNPITCLQATAMLDATGSSQGGDFIFSWSTADGNFAGGTETLTPLASMPGEYTLTITDTLNGCQLSQTAQVVADTVAPAPAIAQPGQLNCAAPEISLDASAGGAPGLTFVWTTPDGNISGNAETLQPQVNQPGLYILEVSDPQNGCFGVAQTLVDADFAVPQVLADPGGTITCADTILTLNATATGTGALAFLWTTADGEILSGADTPAPQIGAAGTYLLQVTDMHNGCTASAEVVTTENQVVPLAAAGASGPVTCASPEVQLDGTSSSTGGPYLYLWTAISGQILSGAETLLPVVSQAGIYQLLVTDTVNQCTGEVFVVVEADLELPVADAGADLALTCNLPQAVLAGQGSTGPEFLYSWSTAGGQIVSGDQTLSPVVGAAGVYELVVTNSQNGCTAADQAAVSFLGEIPFAAVAASPLLTCTITEIPLDASGSDAGAGFVYSWTTTDGLIVSGSNTLAPVVSEPGSYMLSVTNTSTGCVGVAQVSVGADTAAPLAQAGQDAWLTCAVQEWELNGQGSSQGQEYAYAWFTADGFIQSGGNTLTPVAGAPGTYLLSVTNLSNGCVAEDSVGVFQDNTPPVAVVLSPDTLSCASPVIQLDGTGSDSGFPFEYSWLTIDGNILSGSQTLSPEINEPGLYELLIINTLNACYSSITISVAEDIQPPFVEAGGGGVLTCAETMLQLNGTAAGQGPGLELLWTSPDGQILGGEQTLNPLIDQPGLYILTAVDPVNGCAATDEVVVTEDVEAPLILISAPGTITCLSSQVGLNATGSSEGPDFLTGWDTPDGQIVSGAQTLTPLVGAAGTYFLTITDQSNGCGATGSVQVHELIDPPTAEAGEGFTFSCAEELAYLSGAASAASGQVEVAWTTDNGGIVSGANLLNPGISGGGLYFLTVVNLANGCIAQDSVLILENFPYDPEILPRQPPCADDLGQIEIVAVSGGTPPFLYSIDGGASFQGSPVFPNLSPGQYELVVQDALGCVTAPETEEILTPQPVWVELETGVELLQGESYQIQTQVNLPESGIQSVTWTPAAGLSCADCLNPVASPLQTTDYRIEVVDENGCSATALLRIVVDRRLQVFVPNIFSPNGDGENDLFYLFASDGSVRQVRSFLVFDRWGETVCEYYEFQPNNPAYGWDGTHRGKPLDPAVFAWFAEVETNDGRIELLKGDLMLVR